MPTYKFLNTKTNEEILEFMTITERDTFLKENPHMQQLIHGFPGGADPTRVGRVKPDDNFKDLLKEIKGKHYKSNINTW